MFFVKDLASGRVSNAHGTWRVTGEAVLHPASD